MEQTTNLLAKLNYISPNISRPAYFSTGSGRTDKDLVQYETHPVQIRNARHKTPSPTLELDGFELIHQPSVLDRFNDDKHIKQMYYPEIANLLKQRLGASDVIIFDHTYRQDDPDQQRQPVRHVHNDYTPYSAIDRVVELLGLDKATKALSNRYMQINTWRAIENPVYTSPLALAQANSVSNTDLVATDLFYPNRHGEIYEIRYNPDHQWWYYPGMTPDELLLFKGFDSDQTSKTRLVPHTAFEQPEPGGDQPARKSIETRAMAFFKPIKKDLIQ